MTEGLPEMLQLGQHLKMLHGPAAKGPTLVVTKTSHSRWSCTWFEAIELNYFPVNWEGSGARHKRSSPDAGPCKHGSDRWEAKRVKWSLKLQSCAGEAACWARQSAGVNTHEEEWHYWPGLVHKLPREGLRHSRRFLWLTRPVLQQPCPSEEQQAKYLKQQ